MFVFIRVHTIRNMQTLGKAARHAARRDTTCNTEPPKGNRRPGYDPAERAFGFAWTEGPVTPKTGWISESSDRDENNNRIPIPQPCDYVAAWHHRCKRAGPDLRKLRENAPVGFHIILGVSPEWIAELGDLHDTAGEAWQKRVRALYKEALAFVRAVFGDENIIAGRYDNDEVGAGVVDIFVAPLHDSAPGRATTPRPAISTNKALEEIGGGKGKSQLAFGILQDQWAEHARRTLDPRLERGELKTDTGRLHLAPAAYRQMMQRLDEEKEEKEAAIRRANEIIARFQRETSEFVQWAQQWADYVEFMRDIMEVDLPDPPPRDPPEISLPTPMPDPGATPEPTPDQGL